MFKLIKYLNYFWYDAFLFSLNGSFFAESIFKNLLNNLAILNNWAFIIFKSMDKRNFRKAKRDLRKTIGEWTELCSSSEAPEEQFKDLKKEIDLLFLTFSTEGEALFLESEVSEEKEEIRETIDDFTQIYQNFVRDFDGLDDKFNLRNIQKSLEIQNKTVLEQLNNFSDTILGLRVRMDSIKEKTKRVCTKEDFLREQPRSQLNPLVKEFPPSKSSQLNLNPSSSSKQGQISVPLTTESRIDKGDFVPFDEKQGMFSIPSTTQSHAELAAAANPNQFLDVAGFILRHGLMGKSTLKFDGNPMQYVEFMRHFNSCYLSKISDADILLSSLFEMLEGKALQAVRGYRHIPSAEALPKVLETLKSRFGNPHRVQEAHRDKLMSTKKLRDDLDSLTDFLSDLNN